MQYRILFIYVKIRIFVYIVQKAELEQSRVQLQGVQQERDTLLQQVRGQGFIYCRMFSPILYMSFTFLFFLKSRCHFVKMMEDFYFGKRIFSQLFFFVVTSSVKLFKIFYSCVIQHMCSSKVYVSNSKIKKI